MDLSFLFREGEHDGDHGMNGGMNDDMTNPGNDQTAGMDDMNDHNMNSHSMFLSTGTKHFTILFEGADVHTTGAFIGALFASFAFAIIVTLTSQLIRAYEHRVLAKTPPSFVKSLLAAGGHGSRQLLHYAAMLIVMTMNVWIILAVVAGHALGWLVYALFLNAKVSAWLQSKNEGNAELAQKDVGCDC